MVNTRPGYVKHGQGVDEAYRKWGYKLRRARAQATSEQASKRSSSDQDARAHAPGASSPQALKPRIAEPG